MGKGAGGQGGACSLSKNPQHVCNNSNYFFLSHIRNKVGL